MVSAGSKRSCAGPVEEQIQEESLSAMLESIRKEKERSPSGKVEQPPQAG